MKNQQIKFLAILLPLTLACTLFTLSPTPTASPTEISPIERLHFENELVAFDYPAAARIFTARDPAFLPYSNFYKLGGELVVGLANPGWMSDHGILFSSIGIYRHTLPADTSLEEVMQAAYAANTGPAPEEVPEQSGPYPLDGRATVKRTYQFASGPLWYTFQDIWLEADGSVLRISLNMEVYEADFQAAADLFLSSLKIQDDLPRFSEQPTAVPTTLAYAIPCQPAYPLRRQPAFL